MVCINISRGCSLWCYKGQYIYVQGGWKRVEDVQPSDAIMLTDGVPIQNPHVAAIDPAEPIMHDGVISCIIRKEKISLTPFY